MNKYVLFFAPFVVIAVFMIMAAIDRARGRDSATVGFFQRNGILLSTYLIVAVGFWTILIIVLPQLYMIEYSFRHNLTAAQVGGPKDVYTLENYRYLLFGRLTDTTAMNWLHMGVFFRTIIVSALVTFFDFCICYPLAYYIAQVAKGGRARLLILCLIVPFWVNELLRAFAFKILFATSGLIDTMLIAGGVITEPIDFLRHNVGLYSGLSYAYLLSMVFPLYNAIESLDRNQIEAARDLGAPWWHIHLFVVMPFAKPGIASGCTLVFMLCAGALAAPQVLGGPSSLWFTQVVYGWFFEAFNWPRGSAYAFTLLLSCIVFVLAMLRLFKVSLAEIAR
ncbi:MAG: spermidine/putrescine transport system permease protein [Rhodospirillaceae bacterium]|nr:spermidine/putrescine transport system permease protein [Rhodospirillaceae bacterium]